MSCRFVPKVSVTGWALFQPAPEWARAHSQHRASNVQACAERSEQGAHRSTSRSLNPGVVLSGKAASPNRDQYQIEWSGKRKGEVTGDVYNYLLPKRKDKNESRNRCLKRQTLHLLEPHRWRTKESVLWCSAFFLIIFNIWTIHQQYARKQMRKTHFSMRT